MDLHNQESLQDALVELQRSRARERRLFEENQAILAAISAMSGAKNRNQIFARLNDVLSKYINFDDLVVISRSGNTDLFKTLHCTNSIFADKTWSNDTKFTRVLNGECIILYEPSKLNEFRHLNHYIKDEISSALVTGVKTPVTEVVILLFGHTKGQFRIETKETLKRFSPLIERAVIDIENKENLHSLVDARTQELIYAQKEADKANKAKSEFLAMMSHEIRTPLNSVIGMLDVLKQTQINQDQWNVLAQMECSAELLLAIIGDILDLSKIESGNFSLNEQWISLSDTVTAVLSQQKSIAADKELIFNLQYDIDNESLFWLDPTRLTQILFNIVGNAIKFTEFGGIYVHIYHDQHKNILIKVSDTGIGIEQEKIDQLFSPFKQADNSITRRFGGTGLGLAITKHLIELMRGNIRISSNIDIGSEFTITIPSISKPTKHAEVLSDNVRFEQGKSFLIVDDTQSNQMVIKMMLNRLGHNVFITNNGKEALEFLSMHEPSIDMIFMDISMPVMDGLAATREIRKLGIKTPVIALTAHTTDTDRCNCSKSGMDGFIAKPVRIPDIKEIIIDFLS
ncbi:hybrid sensor histidine kinase/response regulator [Vibrio sp. 10N.286.49.B3]|uniref:ATP-binding protein n=1 Tax=Vibrio sp. 10N.286.49.B3 TaxID=1880855 RepID=UPI000C84F136|nr:ATP-binding protein [Vibrio sp. 10N.286.49.B3]PMH46509.1 hybrid sensor histidine kinase/response regulator [Vibrio sp. 10N.286.49.B3]